MALKELKIQHRKMQTRKKRNRGLEDLSEERVREHLMDYQQLIAFWRVYPDKFIDYLCSLNPENTFKLYFCQRLYLRVCLRYKYVYAVYTRGYGKSFLAVLSLMIKSILYPGATNFIAAGGKEQSSHIVQDKIREICHLIPALGNEIEWDNRKLKSTSKTSQTKDSAIFTFKNGSTIENIAVTEKTRGRRFKSGLMEEVIGIDQKLLNEVVLPTLNVARRVNGKVDPKEVLNQSQIYITTAGYKSTFSYDKLIQILCQMVARDDSFILGGTWRVSVMEGLLNKDFIKDLKLDGTFNEASFDREYESKWAGAVEGSFFDSDTIDKCRTIAFADFGKNTRSTDKSYNVLGVDVGRHGCTTEVVVIRVTPTPTGVPRKQVVNLYSFEEEHFGLQAIQIKKLFMLHKCKAVVIDANGLGTGLVDFMITDQTDGDGSFLPNFGVINDEDGRYKNFINDDTIPKAMWLMKANAQINSECYAYVKSQIDSGKLQFLVDENQAKADLLAKKKSETMDAVERAAYLQPYVMTSILRDQMMNLIQKEDSLTHMNIVLTQSSRTIKKDKFSALIYGLYWCKMEEDKGRKKVGKDISKYLFFG